MRLPWGKRNVDYNHLDFRHKKTYLFYSFNKLGSVLLSHALRHSIIGAVGFHCRVRDGIECFTYAIATKLIKKTNK